MATRGTYQFKEPHGVDVTFYHHYDNYPKGAAELFEAARNFVSASPNASFADAFIKANARVEITASHDAHGDTEYRYNYDADKDNRFSASSGRLTMHAFDWDCDEWREAFVGTVDEFIEKYSDSNTTL